MDFQKVNAMAKFDPLPTPHINEMLEKVGQAQFISTLDMTKGYWQIPLATPDQEKTTFGTPWSLFEF